MSYILLTIVFNSLIYVIFKLFELNNIKNLQAIVVNYLMCSLMGFFFTGASQFAQALPHFTSVIPYAVVLGLLFVTVFSCIGESTKRYGVSATSIADKLSFILPVIFAFFVYQEPVTALKIIGILLSMVAIVFAVIDSDADKDNTVPSSWYYPFVVFLGGGVISILLKEIQVRFPEVNYSIFLVFLFGVAFLVGAILILVQWLRKRFQWHGKSILAGIGLGIPNYFSIYFLLQALDTIPSSSIVFPVVNIGIVALSALFGLWFFKEHLKPINIIGLVLAILSIALFLIPTFYE